ncbi:MAG: TorF family putative porin [Hylemonella sp.]|uniref:TorF family putative porin n=1 Tax=Hylemonella sp. TaxID=2066020 RepID=UPI0022C1643C|nr:TorF family putative porin [Hylemonella sp.]MCZ8252766.1 TorF family putative porin [Hylemonella sp.]
MNLKSKIALAALALTAGSSAFAQLAYNVGVVSEYRYRGIAQTAGEPAVQGGLDYAHSSGFYLGAWGSNISWIKDDGDAAGVKTKSNVEIDLYGGYKGAITKDLSYDVGYLRYEFVGNKYKDIGTAAANANTDEAYVGLTYGPATLKYSYAFSNLFGFADSKGSSYADLSATFDLGKGFTVTPHVGVQDIKGKNAAGYSYVDYAVTLGKDFGAGFSGTLALISVNADDQTKYTVNGYRKAKDQVVIGMKYTF